MSEWQPIKSAPKDGREIRVRREGEEAVVRWSRELDDWSLGPADDVQVPGVRRLLPWEPTEWAPV
jgi:hypothetical protein